MGNHRHSDAERRSWRSEGFCERGAQTWAGLLPAWFYKGQDLCLGFSCQKPPSHHMMMSLIPRDLSVKTEWFWLPSSPLTSLLYRKGSVLESGRIPKWGLQPGCKTSLEEICLIMGFKKWPSCGSGSQLEKPTSYWVKIICGLLTIYNEIIPGENSRALHLYCLAQGLPQCRNSQIWVQRMNLLSLIWETRQGAAYNEGQGPCHGQRNPRALSYVGAFMTSLIHLLHHKGCAPSSQFPWPLP